MKQTKIDGYYIPYVHVDKENGEPITVLVDYNQKITKQLIEVGDKWWNMGIEVTKNGNEWCKLSTVYISCPVFDNAGFDELYNCNKCLASNNNADVLLKLDLKLKMDKYLNED
jgi:hypothetical protein